MYFDGFFCSGSSGEDQNQNRSNDEPKDVLALLAAKDDLTNSVDVEKEFALDNLHLENGRKYLIILTGIGHNYLLESIMGKLNIFLISL